MTCNDHVDDSLVWMQFGKTKYGVIHGIVYLYIAKSNWYLPSNTDQNVDQGASCLFLLLLLVWTDDERKKGNYWENPKPSATEPLLILLSSFDSSVTSPSPPGQALVGLSSWRVCRNIFLDHHIPAGLNNSHGHRHSNRKTTKYRKWGAENYHTGTIVPKSL